MTNVILFTFFAIVNLSLAFIKKEKGWKIAHLIVGIICLGKLLSL